MVAPSRPQHLTLPVAPLAAGAVGVLTAAMFALVPTDLLEAMVVDSGIASVLSAAEPPLGVTARLVLVLLCGGGAGAIAWFGLFLLFGTRTIVVQRSGKGAASAPVQPVLRRADAHPDAPARRPLFANTDLGTPFLEVRARAVHIDAAAVAPAPSVPPRERALPADLDQPLAAYDPGAVPDEPLDWFPPPVQLKPAPRRPTFDPGERFESFPPTPIARPTPPESPLPPLAKPDPSETIQGLLDRLERIAGPGRAAAPAPPPETIEDTLTSLRRMAMR